MQLATHTLNAIDRMLEADGGAKYRGILRSCMAELEDAYSTSTDPFRSHLGASLIGRNCDREIWYGFRYTTLPKHPARIIRLFNRGHLEEGRIVALLRAIGVEVYQFDENGKQYRISDCNGHFGGAGDGVGLHIPDIPVGEACLLEFKTHGVSSFKKVIDTGVQVAKPEHYCQMQTYMEKMKLKFALYVAVCKDTDALHMEIIVYDGITGQKMIERANSIIFSQQAPARISDNPSAFACKFCDHKAVCQQRQSPHKSCRSCRFAAPYLHAEWFCFFDESKPVKLEKQFQYYGCQQWIIHPDFES